MTVPVYTSIVFPPHPIQWKSLGTTNCLITSHCLYLLCELQTQKDWASICWTEEDWGSICWTEEDWGCGLLDRGGLRAAAAGPRRTEACGCWTEEDWGCGCWTEEELRQHLDREELRLRLLDRGGLRLRLLDRGGLRLRPAGPRRTEAAAAGPRRTEAAATGPRRTEAASAGPRRTEAASAGPRRTEAWWCSMGGDVLQQFGPHFKNGEKSKRANKKNKFVKNFLNLTFTCLHFALDGGTVARQNFHQHHPCASTFFWDWATKIHGQCAECIKWSLPEP